MTSNDTLKNAVIGAVESIVLFFLPFSPALGGALAGYLQGNDTNEGLRVGALSGVIAAVPLALIAIPVAGFFLVAVQGRASVAFLVFFFVGFIIALVYSVGLGAYVRDEFGKPTETPPERLRTDETARPPSQTEFDEPIMDDRGENERRD